MAEASPPATTASTTASTANNNKTIVTQLKKLTEANAKYKNLLKLAKERIQQHEEEASGWKTERSRFEERIEELNKKCVASGATSNGSNGSPKPPDLVTNILRVARRIRNQPLAAQAHSNNNTPSEEIWALLDMEETSEESPHHNRRYQTWERYATESDLLDAIRRDTGEPLVPPPYSLSPEQAAEVEQQAEAQVAAVTEEFRRFRVKAELARTQVEAQVQELQSAARRGPTTTESTATNPLLAVNNGTTDAEQQQLHKYRQQLERLQVTMTTQETQWKQAYDTLVEENTALKSAGSEALLAAQWRQRYETCYSEKQALEERLNSVVAEQGTTAPHTAGGGDVGERSYEQKYRDLKGTWCWCNLPKKNEPGRVVYAEIISHNQPAYFLLIVPLHRTTILQNQTESFRLYRKKAKEIFEAQQLGSEGGGLSSAAALSITSNSSADAKLSYLKNLMLNYLTADPTVRDHMEGAIGTVLQFTPEERQRVETKKSSSADAWFYVS